MFYRPVTRLPGLLLATSIFAPTLASAAGLGEITLLSRIGEPLLAEVLLIGAETAPPEADCFSLAPVSGSDLPVITRARIRLVRRQNAQHLLITGQQAINEPILALSLLARCDMDLRRDYILMPEAPPHAVDSPPAFTPERLAPWKEKPGPRTQARPNSPPSKTAPPPPASERKKRTAPRGNEDRLLLDSAPAEIGDKRSEMVDRLLKMETALRSLNLEMDALNHAVIQTAELSAARHELQLAQSLQQLPASRPLPPPPSTTGKVGNWLELLFGTLLGGSLAAGLATLFAGRAKTARPPLQPRR